MRKVIVLGAGFGGLSVAWMLARKGGFDVTVIEKKDVTGGLCATFEHKGHLLDYGPHKCYSVIPGILDELKSLMGNEFLKLEKSNSIFLFNKFLKYPLSITDLILKMGLSNMFACMGSVASTFIKKKKDPESILSYKDYMIDKFGKQIYQLVFEPLADKIWADPHTLSADIARARIPATNIIDTLLRASGLKKESQHTDAAYFYYPEKGFGRITQRMHEEIIKLGGKILTDTFPVAINTHSGHVRSVDVETKEGKKTLDCDLLLSSINIKNLIELIKDETGQLLLEEALSFARSLEYRAVFLVYFFLNREHVTNHHWIFFPQRDVIFGRIFETKSMSEHVGPNGESAICCDFTDYEGGPLWNMSDHQLIDKCKEDLKKVGIIKEEWIKDSLLLRVPKFYPRYDIEYKDKVSSLYKEMKKVSNLLLTGRIGFYNYNNSDHCLDMGRFIADDLAGGKEPNEIWDALEERVAHYRIVD